MKQKKILITLPYSFNYRNIVLTGILEQLLLKNCQVLILVPSSLLEDKFLVDLIDKYPSCLKIDELIRPKSKSFLNLLFTLVSSIQFSIQNTYSYRIKKKYFKKANLKNYFKFVLPTFFLPQNKSTFKILRKFFFNILKNERVHKQIHNFSPDLIFLTLNNKINEYFYIKYALYYDIKTVSLIHSWDVITTKGNFVYSTDKVLVWNKVNESEYDYFVNKLFNNSSKIIKVGIPQFDIYSEKLKLINPEDIKTKLKIPLDKKIVVYTTAVKSLFPEEKELVSRLIKDFEENFFINSYLYIRLHPQEANEYYNDLPLEGKNFKIHIPEISSKEIEDSVKFSENTLLKLFDDLFVADIVVNMASSITLDATALDKPVLNIAFDNTDNKKKDYDLSVKRYYDTDHFSKIINSDEVKVCFSYEELSYYIKEVKDLRAARLLKKSYIYDFGNAKNNIVNELTNNE